MVSSRPFAAWRPSGARPSENGRPRPSPSSRSNPALILGGAGFIGTNSAARLLCEGSRVLLFDDLSRTGARKNLRWLSEAFGSALEVQVADVRDAGAVRAAVSRASIVFHLAAQVAVTTSLADPWANFEVNVNGTLNVYGGATCAS